MGKRLLSAIFTFLICSAAFARDVCFQIVQHNNSLNEVSENSMIIEDELIDRFFSGGHIVSNLPACVSKETDNKVLWGKSIKAAQEGGSEVFVQINLFFNSDEAVSVSKVALGQMDKVIWKAVSLWDGKTIGAKNLSVTKPIGIDTEENVRFFADELAADLIQAVK